MQVKTVDALRVEAQDALERLKDEGGKRGVTVVAAGPADGTGFTLTLDEKTDAAKLKDLVKSILPPNAWSVDERGREWKIALQGRRADRDRGPGGATGRRDDPQPRRRPRCRRARHPAAGHGPDRRRDPRRRRPEPRQGDHRDDRPPRAEARGRQGRPLPVRGRRRRPTAARCPSDLEVVEGFNEDADARTRTPVFYVLKRAAAVTGRDLKNARVDRDKFNQPAVMFFLNAAGAVKFAKVTGENVGKRLAIVLDKRVQSAPVINSQIKESGIIEGNFTAEKADALSLVLRSGALPAEMIILEERTVGPSLGLDSIKKGVLASIVGMICVFVAMIVYYRLAGRERRRRARS